MTGINISIGTIIDHIQPRKAMELAKFLNLDQSKNMIMILQNVKSKSLENKDMIIIGKDINIDMDKVGFKTPGATINLVKDSKIVQKIHADLPEEIFGILKCKNNKCITNYEKIDNVKFILENPETKEYRCEYCSKKTNFEG